MREENGFTLIELMVVIAIISISMFVVIPKIESNTKMNLDKSARRLAGAIIFVRNEVIFKNKKFRIKYDIEENTYSIDELVKTSMGFVDEEYEAKEITTVSFEDGVSYMDITTEYGGRLNFGKTYTHFFPTGMVERTRIHIKNENDDIKTLDVNVLTGEVDIFDKYYDEDSY